MSDPQADVEVLIIGAGVGGLTAALELHRVGVTCTVVEAVRSFHEVGVGINILPHASRLLGELGLADKLTHAAVLTKESSFFNRYGQLIYTEPAGLYAGFSAPQYSIHRADLHRILLDAVRERLGADAVRPGHRVDGVRQDGRKATAQIEMPDGSRRELSAGAIVAADGIHSVVRASLYPDEGAPRYSGVTMWRGVTPWHPILSGATMVRAGWLSVGKLVIYPIRDRVDDAGRQLVNWVAELETPRQVEREWTRRGDLSDIMRYFADWTFDWLDVPAFLRSSETVLEYPMVDQDPLPRWSFDRITLLGDAAHPMLPRGSNGAGQAILDARSLAESLVAHRDDPVAGLVAYETARRAATTAVVLTNRLNPPDAILREVHERIGDRPFDNLNDYISRAELQQIAESYREVTGLAAEKLRVNES